jgi:hypothetical protein
MKNIFVLRVVSILVVISAIVYAIALAIFKPEPETFFVLLSSQILCVPLNFYVSAWWNMPVFLLALTTVFYASKFQILVGKRPAISASSGIKVKQEVREMLETLRFFSVVISVAAIFFSGIFFIIPGFGAEGPLSSVASGILLYFLIYNIFGFCISFVFSFCSGTTGIEGFYTQLMKAPIIRSLPFLLVASIAYFVFSFSPDFKQSDRKS